MTAPHVFGAETGAIIFIFLPTVVVVDARDDVEGGSAVDVLPCAARREWEDGALKIPLLLTLPPHFTFKMDPARGLSMAWSVRIPL